MEKRSFFCGYLKGIEAAAKTTTFFSTAAAKRKYFPINIFNSYSYLKQGAERHGPQMVLSLVSLRFRVS